MIARDEQDRSWLTHGRPVSFWFTPQGFLTAVQQEVTRAHKADKWALDGVKINTEVTEFERVDQVRTAPREGVYIHGLSLDGAASNKAALSKEFGRDGPYDCPVYKYPKRTDRYIIF